MAFAYTTTPTAPPMPGNPEPLPKDMPSGPPPPYDVAMGLTQVFTCEPQQTIKQRYTDSFYHYDLLQGTTLNTRKIAIVAIIAIPAGLVVIGVVCGTLVVTGSAPLVIGLGALGATTCSATVLGAFCGAVASPWSRQHAGQVLRPCTEDDLRELRDRAMKRCEYNCLQIDLCRTENRAIDKRRTQLEQDTHQEELRNRPVRELNQQLRERLHFINGMMSMVAYTDDHGSGHCSRHYYHALENHRMIDAALPDPATPYADQLRADRDTHLRNSNRELAYLMETKRLCQLYRLNLEDKDGMNPSVSLRPNASVLLEDLPD